MCHAIREFAARQGELTENRYGLVMTDRIVTRYLAWNGIVISPTICCAPYDELDPSPVS